MMPQCSVSEKYRTLPDVRGRVMDALGADWTCWHTEGMLVTLMLTCCGAVQPSLATLLAKPDKPMHESTFAMNGGQTRKLQSYFPDPTMDIDNKVSAPLSCVSSRYTNSRLCCFTCSQPDVSAFGCIVGLCPAMMRVLGHVMFTLPVRHAA